MKTRTIIAMLALVAIGPLEAATYYVSNAGSDSNSGTSASAPWATVAHMNAQSLNPGDVVSFQAGGIWREQLAPKSGASTGNVIYNAYGSGPKPLFLGSLSAASTSMWSSLGGNKWATPNGSFPTDIGNLNFNNPSYIANPSFNVDPSGWSFYVNTAGGASATFARDTSNYEIGRGPACGAVVVTSNGTTSSDLQLFRGNLSVTAGKVYRLTFRAKATAAFTMPLPRLMKQSGSYSNYYSATSAWTGAVTTAWSTFTLDFTTSANANDMKLNFSLGDAIPNGATFYIDDIFLWDLVDHRSQITNPSFAVDLSTWSTFVQGTGSATTTRSTSTYYTAPAACAVAVANHGTTTADVQLATSDLSIISGKVYRLSFTAKASTNITGLAAPALIKQATPYNSYTSNVGPFAGTITPNWTTFTIDYTANTTANDARLVFLLGNAVPNGATFYVDEITFTEICPVVDTSVQNMYMALDRKINYTDLTQVDEFWYDKPNQRIVMYSTGDDPLLDNPAVRYATIECAVGNYQLSVDTRNYVTVDGLAFWNGGKDSVNVRFSDHITVKNCDIRYIGGAYTNPNDNSHIRFGNAMQVWRDGTNIWFTNNYAENIYDSGISPQGSQAVNHQQNLYFQYNTLIACEMSYEIWDNPTGSTIDNIYFDHNVCRNAGTSWSHHQRPNQPTNAGLIKSYSSAATATHIYIRNNLFDTSEDWVYFLKPGFTDIDNVTLEHNTYRQRLNTKFASWNGVTYDANAAGFADYQRDSGKDGTSTFTTDYSYQP